MPRKLWLLCLVLSLVISFFVPRLFSVIFILISWIIRFILSHWDFDFPASQYEELPDDGWPICFLISFGLTVLAWLSRFGTLGILDLVIAFTNSWLTVAVIVWVVFKIQGKT